MTRYHCWNRRLKEVAAMKQKAYRQNPTVIDLSKKARPPPGETTLIYMNCLIIWILLTMPMRPSGLFGRAHFVRSKNFWRNFKKSSAFLKNAVLPREKGGSTTNFPTRKEVRMWNLIAGSFTNSVLFRSFVIRYCTMKLYLGWLLFVCHSLKVFPEIACPMVKPPVGIKVCPVVYTDLFNGSFINSMFPQHFFLGFLCLAIPIKWS